MKRQYIHIIYVYIYIYIYIITRGHIPLIITIAVAKYEFLVFHALLSLVPDR
jgi:hypothetical protein